MYSRAPICASIGLNSCCAKTRLAAAKKVQTRTFHIPILPSLLETWATTEGRGGDFSSSEEATSFCGALKKRRHHIKMAPLSGTEGRGSAGRLNLRRFGDARFGGCNAVKRGNQPVHAPDREERLDAIRHACDAEAAIVPLARCQDAENCT